MLGALGAGLPEAGADARTAQGSYTFAALNQAALADVACIHVPSGVVVEQPVHVLCLSTGAAPTANGAADPVNGAAEQGAPATDDDATDDDARPVLSSRPSVLAASHPNVVIAVDEGASVKVLQQYVGEGAYFTNGVTRVHLAEGAAIEHSYVQEQSMDSVHLDTLQVDVAADARYEQGLLMSGGRLNRVNLMVSLSGEGAHSALSGLTLATDSQLSDVHSSVVHASPGCTSEQEQRNAVAGRARVVFRGAVVVPRGADNTTAAQLCRSLLLSDTARVDVQPTLEIDTDDVSCTHGATVSDLDDEMIFYLQARGLSRLQARSLLLEGWARSALAKVPSDGAKLRAATKAATLAPEDRSAVRRERLSSI